VLSLGERRDMLATRNLLVNNIAWPDGYADDRERSVSGADMTKMPGRCSEDACAEWLHGEPNWGYGSGSELRPRFTVYGSMLN